VAVYRWQVQQHREPGGTLDEGADRGAAQPEDQIPFPVAGNGTVRGLLGPSVDPHLGADEMLPTLGPGTGLA